MENNKDDIRKGKRVLVAKRAVARILERALFFLFFACLFIQFYIIQTPPAHAFEKIDKSESVYDRVMRTGTIRCAYILGLAPEMMKDPNTGVLSGISYDIAEELGRRLHLDIEWTEEVTFPTMATGLQTGRYDAVCISLYRDTRRAPITDFTIPLFYNAQGTYVRADDNRFDGNLSAMNDPAVTIVTIDGEMSQYIAEEDLPRAQTLSLPQTTDLAFMMENVALHKADVAFVNTGIAAGYMKANPGKIKEVNAENPIRLFSHGFMFGKGQYDFARMLDLALEEMRDQGFIRKTMEKYDPEGRAYMLVAKPYTLPEKE
ncbi:MAG: transporter substrate-binding domain-containing protein [Alphaproteobacteria bacterium]|nr:transporter substrate-binding domain-containing protein [Alphaproteobacteria bacterium]